MSAMGVSHNVLVMSVEIKGIPVRMGSETSAEVIYLSRSYQLLCIDMPALGW